MAYEPYPFVVTDSGDAGDAPSVAQPIALYGAGSGEGAITLPIAQSDVTGLEGALNGKADTTHTHAAADIASGTLNAARIPNLAISKITDLESRLTAIEGRLTALENAAG